MGNGSSGLFKANTHKVDAFTIGGGSGVGGNVVSFKTPALFDSTASGSGEFKKPAPKFVSTTSAEKRTATQAVPAASFAAAVTGGTGLVSALINAHQPRASGGVVAIKPSTATNRPQAVAPKPKAAVGEY